MRAGWCASTVAVCLVAGCGAVPNRGPSSPASRSLGESGARAEIARLEERIAARRRELGLSTFPGSPAPTSGASGGAGAPPGATAAAEEAQGRDDAPPPIASPAAPPPARAEAASSPAQPSERSAHAARRSVRCSQVAEASDEICEASRRICRLAGELGDGDARRSCAAARVDCEHAAEAAGRCK